MRQAPYQLYGLALASPLDLPCPRAPAGRRADVSLRAGRGARFAALRPRTSAGRPSRRWFSYRRLSDGATFVRWAGLFEFLISPDGRDIEFLQLPRATPESLSAYLLGQVLSFSLLAFGVEPLHGTVVVANGAAVGLLGDCGYGKSTLGAAFLQRGFPILTDDVIVLERAGAGFAVHPGMPRIKLFPEMSRALLGARRGRGRPRLNDGTAKQILALDDRQTMRRPVPLRALYVLGRPGAQRPEPARVAIAPLSAGAACVELIRATFNTIVVDRARLERQFAFASALAAAVPVRRLDYPRRLSRLPSVCEAVLADLA